MSQPLPEIGKTYNHFDDGKIKLSNLHQTTIMDIIPFNEIDNTTKSFWENEKSFYDWLYAQETDYFIIGHLNASYMSTDDKVIYVRTKYGEWFSIGELTAGILDVNGKLTEKI